MSNLQMGGGEGISNAPLAPVIEIASPYGPNPDQSLAELVQTQEIVTNPDLSIDVAFEKWGFESPSQALGQIVESTQNPRNGEVFSNTTARYTAAVIDHIIHTADWESLMKTEKGLGIQARFAMNETMLEGFKKLVEDPTQEADIADSIILRTFLDRAQQALEHEKWLYEPTASRMADEKGLTLEEYLYGPGLKYESDRMSLIIALINNPDQNLPYQQSLDFLYPTPNLFFERMNHLKLAQHFQEALAVSNETHLGDNMNSIRNHSRRMIGYLGLRGETARLMTSNNIDPVELHAKGKAQMEARKSAIYEEVTP